jgi:hypothetical protein
MDLKQHQVKIAKLPYRCYSLRSAAGKRLISANAANQPSKLPAIIAALEDMPPGEYVIRCSNGSKDGYDYPINTATQGTNAPVQNVSFSQASADDLKTAERLGRLESENAYLQQQLAEASERILALTEALEEDWNDEADDILGDPAPSPKEQILEAIAPIIPALADKALALVDRFLNKPAAQPLSERAPVQAAPVIDYERLAEMVSQKLMEAQEPEEIS